MLSREHRAGCDGLIVTGTGAQVTGSGSSVSTLKSTRGACIVFFPAPPPAAAPAAAPVAQRVCTPGATQPCTGPAGCSGGQRCNENGLVWGICDCGRVQGGPTTEL